MATFPKKLRLDETFPIFIHLCDSFVRTPEKVICPFMKAEDSVHALYKLQEPALKDILCEAGEMLGLELISITSCSTTEGNQRMDGNILIEYRASKLWDEDTFKTYKGSVQSKLQHLNIRNVFIDHGMEQSSCLQPIITDIDSQVHILDSKYQKHLSQYSAEADIIPAELQSIRTLLKELKERRISIALLSHNAIGKSFFLNLLLLLTEESYRESGKDEKKRKIKLPKDITGSPTVKMMKEDHFEDLPEVIKDFLNHTDDEQDFKKIMQPICHELNFTNQKELRRIENVFSAALSRYYSEDERIDMVPYLLPQKDDSGGYDSTTKCVVHLRYGGSFQARVEYFDEKELQNQLFELVSLENESEETRPDIVYERMKERSRLSLKARYSALTDNDEETLHSILKSITSPGHIRLCEQVMTFAGKTELYVGNGVNQAEDRLALQKLLNEYMSLVGEDTSTITRQKVAALKRIVVYVPSRLLYGGTEILEMPGTNESDPLAMSFIQDALDTVDVVVLLSEFGFKLAGQEVKDTLRNSRFIKNWIKNSQAYKLMFLSYPEKDQTFLCGRNDGDKLKKIKLQENGKRDKEFQELEKLIHPVPLSSVMKNNTFSSYVFPMLHTAIHAIEGIPHEILEDNKDVLKNTGIDAVMKELDQFIVQRKQSIIEEIESKLADFEMSQKDEAKNGQESDAGSSSQNIDFTQESDFLKKNKDLLNDLKMNHEELIKNTVNGKLKELMERSTTEAGKNWAEIQSKVTDSGFFNPQYNGQHPAYKIKMYNKLFGHLDEEISQIFRILLKDVYCVLENYKEKATKLFTRELQYQKKKQVTVRKSLGCALDWYMGKTRSSFNENTLMKSVENLFKESMKKHILEPAYNDSIENTNRRMATQIQQVLKDVQETFLKNTISLYNERWPANLAKFMVRSCFPLTSIHNSQPSCTFCGDIRCSVCNYIESTTTFTSSRKKTEFKFTQTLSCISKNVIYLITCKKCKQQYVGQTSNSVRRRFIDHLSTINRKKDLTLPKHFNLPNHSIHDVALVVIEQVTNVTELLKRERYWIRELDTLTPNGLNEI
ncbi:uncharacterized protein LOC142136838 [Mixophyes fleayi]|uniref:uncharacterized protein LOC142136838 n=1 Tax=Mixophyes fleayi TaxID=3061075 RepID=UPI003F4DF250